MKFKFFITVFFLFAFCHISIQAAQYDSDTDIDIDEQDYEYEEKEVSVSSSIISELIQMFAYENYAYKGIEYESLYKNYEQQVMTIINEVLKKSELSEDEQYYSDAYTIVGEEQEYDYEPLYDRLKARKNLTNLIANFVNQNEEDVRNTCIGVVLQEHTSRVVWKPGCCDLQIHKNCFLQCRDKGLTKCMNSFCTASDWNKAFYAQAIKKRRSVPVQLLYDSNCPLCMEPLKSKKNYEQPVNFERNLNKGKKGLIIDKNGITPGAKKIRFIG